MKRETIFICELCKGERARNDNWCRACVAEHGPIRCQTLGTSMSKMALDWLKKPLTGS